MSNHFIVNQIPSRGKTIVRKLYSGLLLLKNYPLKQMSRQLNRVVVLNSCSN